MKKLITIFYIIWVSITLIFSIITIDSFYPNYNSEFILFIDFSTIIFVPSLYILIALCIQIMNIIVKSLKIKICFIILILIITSIYLTQIIKYNIIFKIINFVVSLIFGFIYFITTEFIYRKSSLFKKK